MTKRIDIAVSKRYLRLPVRNDAPMRRLHIEADGEEVLACDIELAEGEPDFWVAADLGPFVGLSLALTIDGMEDPAGLLDAAFQSDAPVDREGLYHEALRPQFHFSSQRGWNNDPNGLVFYEGEYHLFYQHNPYGWKWGNMHWGHAVSPDLVHWRELGDVLAPDALGTMFSGSAVVDWANTTGFQGGDRPPLVCIYTSAGEPFVQSIAYSLDSGRTLTKYAGNPVVEHIVGSNRDPKVIRHKPSGQWVMALYLDGHDYALFGSPDLKAWRRLDRLTLGEASECPDLFELPVDGDPADTRWLFWGADGSYVLGDFDGETFTPEGEIHRYNWGGDAYAAQTWSDIPDIDGRRIQIAWLRVNLPGMPFNQSMTFPCELTLRTTPEGVRLFSQPVREVSLLHRESRCWPEQAMQPGDPLPVGVKGDLLDIRAEFAVGAASEVGLEIHGIPVRYDVAEAALICEGRTVPLPTIDGCIRLQILVDRTSIEIFGNDGQVALPLGVIAPADEHGLSIYAVGGDAAVRSLVVHELASAWPR